MKGKEAWVEDVLSKLASLLLRKNPSFDKDEAFDVLIELKAVARSSSHAKLPYSRAVFQALKDTTSAPLISSGNICQLSWDINTRNVS